METIIDLDLYLERDEIKKSNDKAKLKRFFQFLSETYYNYKPFDSSFFEKILDEDAFLYGLLYYMEKAHVQTKNSASSYRRTIITFYDLLRDDFGVHNPTFPYRGVISESFDLEFDGFVKTLSDTVNKGCLSDEDAEILIDVLDEYFSQPNMYENILNAIDTGNEDKYDIYVSALAVHMVMEYGFRNNVVVGITLSDIDSEKNALQRKGMEFLMNQEFVNYLKIRNIILKRNKVETNMLFVQMNGRPYANKNGSVSNPLKFWKIMNQHLHHTSVGAVAYRRIVELVDMGADIEVLSEATGYGSKTIQGLYGIDRLIQRQKDNLMSILNKKKNIIRAKGMIKCPFCGEEKDASSENWVLREDEFDGRKIRRIACKNCKGGNDGKYRY